MQVVDCFGNAVEIGATGLQILKELQRKRENRIGQRVAINAFCMIAQEFADAGRVERRLSGRHGGSP